MCGWATAAAACASTVNRCSRARSAANVAGSTFTATRRVSDGDPARRSPPRDVRCGARLRVPQDDHLAVVVAQPPEDVGEQHRLLAPRRGLARARARRGESATEHAGGLIDAHPQILFEPRVA